MVEAMVKEWESGVSLFGWRKALPEAIGCLNESPSTRGGLICELLAREMILEISKTIKSIATAAGCMPELDGEALWLMASHPEVLLRGLGVCTIEAQGKMCEPVQ